MHAQPQFYRYTRTDGILVISATIPPEFVSKGYDVILQDGSLVKRVLPELSKREKAALLKAAEQKRRLEEWDKKLLSRYSRLDDLESAKKRKLDQLQGDIAITERNVEKIISEINHYQHLAANEERQGLIVSERTLDKIERLKRSRERESQNILRKREAKKIVEDIFNKDIQRFKIIRPE